MGYRSPNDQCGPSTSEDDLVLGFCVASFLYFKRHPPSGECLFKKKNCRASRCFHLLARQFFLFAYSDICKAERLMRSVFCLMQQPWSRLESQRCQHGQQRSDLRYDRIR